MSLFQRTITPLRTSSRALQFRVAVSSFHKSAIRSALSESDHDQDKQSRESKIDEHKHDSLSKQKNKDGEWKPELASNSEQAIKAAKSDMSIEEMQKMGENKAKEDK